MLELISDSVVDSPEVRPRRIPSQSILPAGQQIVLGEGLSVE